MIKRKVDGVTFPSEPEHSAGSIRVADLSFLGKKVRGHIKGGNALSQDKSFSCQ